MTADNDYYKILKALAAFHNDSDYHEIEFALGEEQPYERSDHFKRVIQELRKQLWIQKETGTGMKGFPITIGGKGRQTVTIDSKDTSYRPLKARITQAGLEKFYDLDQRVKKEAVENQADQSFDSSSLNPDNPNHMPSTPITNNQTDINQKRNSPTKVLQRNIFIVAIISMIIAALSLLLSYLKGN